MTQQKTSYLLKEHAAETRAAAVIMAAKDKRENDSQQRHSEALQR
jgi:hypothetical protein